ncbi:DUF1622 domain-containing protein [Candidatus Bathyarchaeota archaeon]|nr:DUF1622 domain-containing protein [Candidatus Bathyarchaeota archaeon]
MSGKKTQSNGETKRKDGRSNLTLSLMVVIAVLTALGVILTPRSNEFLPVFNDVILTLLNVAADILYLLGGGLIFFGVLLITIRFINIKLKDPYRPSGVTRFLSGYLTLSLEFFIGAEIIKTVVVRNYEEFSLLILVIISRGLFSLILYLERRWHGTAETE